MFAEHKDDNFEAQLFAQEPFCRLTRYLLEV
jgi:hypothetical protein